MWQTSFLKNALSSVQQYLHEVFFHHCMFGSKRAKRTKLLVNHSYFDHLNRECDQGHPHEKWGHTQSGWATALEVEYPLQLCREYAACLRSTLLAHGALAPPTEMMQDDSLNLNLAAKASLGIPVRGKRPRPLMREHSHVLHILGPKSFIYVYLSIHCPKSSKQPWSSLQPARPAQVPWSSRLMLSKLKPLHYWGSQRGKLLRHGKKSTGCHGSQWTL